MIDTQKAAQFALSMVGCPYVYGGTGKPCTPNYRLARTHQYPGAARNIRRYCPVLSGQAPDCAACRWNGLPAYDCAQLVRYALRAGGQRVPSGASTLWRYAPAWSYRGPLDMDWARKHFCVLFRRDIPASDARPMAHTGLCLGDGRVVDGRGHRDGVILTDLSAYPWTDMAVPDGLPGPANPKETEKPGIFRALVFGSRGEEVRRLQRRLIDLGHQLPRFGADGIYGGETAAAVKAFQLVRGLPPTGLVFRDTHERMWA